MTAVDTDYAEDLFGSSSNTAIVRTQPLSSTTDVPYLTFKTSAGQTHRGHQLGVAHAGGWCYVQDENDGGIWIIAKSGERWRAVADPAVVAARTAKVETIMTSRGFTVASFDRIVHVSGCRFANLSTKAPLAVQRAAVDAIMRGDAQRLPNHYRLCARCLAV